MARSTVFAALVGFLAVFIWRQGKFLSLIAFTQPLPSHYFAYGNAATHCKVVKDPVNDELRFCEDGFLWNGNKLVLSCDPNRLNWNTVMGPLRDPNPRGALWVYDYTSSGNNLYKVTLAGYPPHADFHPLGLAVHSDPATAKHTLFAVNHGRNASTVEVFDLAPHAPYTATYRRTLSHYRFVAPNAIAPTSATSFYLSQDHLFTRRLPFPFGAILSMLETLFGLPFGQVNHVSFDASSSAPPQISWVGAGGVPFANGVALDKSGTRFAVASSSKGTVRFYARDPVTNALAHKETVQLPFGPDNIGYHGDALVAAGHPMFLRLLARARGHEVEVGSWVVSIRERTGPETAVDEDAAAPLSARKYLPPSKGYVVKTLYQSDGSGDGFGISTSGILDLPNKAFFVTGLYTTPGLLQCSTK
ncbi:hypothetical protein AURDEDRAFT_182789 [Auricularia subglabra TFB-10046 SS5]|nr:hypothetical protein AURDEDRAFT_182789 [Auricularia subglabra TFB-10046 SS5]